MRFFNSHAYTRKHLLTIGTLLIHRHELTRTSLTQNMGGGTNNIWRSSNMCAKANRMQRVHLSDGTRSRMCSPTGDTKNKTGPRSAHSAQRATVPLRKKQMALLIYQPRHTATLARAVRAPSTVAKSGSNVRKHKDLFCALKSNSCGLLIPWHL